MFSHDLKWMLLLFHALNLMLQDLTHRGRVTDICVNRLTIIDSDNGLCHWSAPSHYLNQCWNNVSSKLGISSIEIVNEIYTFSLKKMHSKMSSTWFLCLSFDSIYASILFHYCFPSKMLLCTVRNIHNPKNNVRQREANLGHVLMRMHSFRFPIILVYLWYDEDVICTTLTL